MVGTNGGANKVVYSAERTEKKRKILMTNIRLNKIRLLFSYNIENSSVQVMVRER
jgi:hypothetical protein